ncbi:MAG: hypothetical protein II997_03915 [Clostridia bacterium]|nr:hypothetical protein [Clostridia bacterium]
MAEIKQNSSYDKEVSGRIVANVRITVSLRKEQIESSEMLMKLAGAKNQSEYIRKAIETYNEYILNPEDAKWKSPMAKSVENSVKNMLKHYERLVFKNEVMIAKLYWLMVRRLDVEQEWGDEIHQVAVFDAKRTHGEFNSPKE